MSSIYRRSGREYLVNGTSLCQAVAVREEPLTRYSRPDRRVDTSQAVAAMLTRSRCRVIVPCGYDEGPEVGRVRRVSLAEGRSFRVVGVGGVVVSRVR
jgi:hypothetical protein